MFSGSSGILWRQSVETQGWRNTWFACKNRDRGIRRRSAGEQCWDSDCHSMEDALSWADTGQGVRKWREGNESWSCWAGYRRLRIGRCQRLPGFQMCQQLVTVTIHTQSPLWQCSCCASWGGLGSCEGRVMVDTQSALGQHPWNICLLLSWIISSAIPFLVWNRKPQEVKLTCCRKSHLFYVTLAQGCCVRSRLRTLLPNTDHRGPSLSHSSSGGLSIATRCFIHPSVTSVSGCWWSAWQLPVLPIQGQYILFLKWVLFLFYRNCLF